MTGATAPVRTPPAAGADWRHYREALGVVLGTLGVPDRVSTTAPAAPDPVAAAVAAAGVRAARVDVADALTRIPRRPVLAVRSADHAPVALLPGRRGWRYAGPAVGDGSSPPVDASELEPSGWTFCRQLPHAGVTGWPLLGFALRGGRAPLATTTAAGLVAAVLAFATPIGSIVVVGAVLTDRPGLLVAAASTLVGFVVLAALAGVVRDRAATALQSHLQSTVEPAVWDRLLRQPLPFFRQYPVRRLLNYANGFNHLRQLLGSSGLDAVLGALFSCAALALLCTVDVQIGLTALAVVAVLLTALAWLAWHQQQHDQRVYEGVDDVQALLYPALVGIDEVHAYSGERAVYLRWEEAFARQKSADAKGLRYAEVSTALLVGTQPVLLAVLVPLCWSSGAGLAAFWVVGFAAIQLNLALGRLSSVLQGVFAVGPVHARMRPILTTPPETPPGRRLPGRLRGEIELRGVTFSYPGTRSPVLRDVDLRVAPGEMLAVVGASGAGKSTLLRLVLGLERPESGTVLLDGQDLADLDLDVVRAQLGYVPQDAKALRGDVRSVVLGGAVDQRDALAWEALTAAGMAEDVRALPMGLATKVTDGSSGFSGGQLQRLLIARALAKRPGVVLLDEATSALDNAVQDEVSEAIARLGVTRLVVAHRLSTVRRADRVVEVEAGRLVPRGTGEELLARQGRQRAEAPAWWPAEREPGASPPDSSDGRRHGGESWVR